MPGPAPAINPTLTQQTPENRRAEPSLPLPSQATELPQSARAATPVSGGPTPDATAGGSTNPALYPLAQLTAIRRDPPAYPRIAPEGAEASVDLVMTVTETGTVEDVEVRGNPPDYFVRSAIQAVKRWRFLPVLDNGEPVAVRTTVRLTFRG